MRKIVTAGVGTCGSNGSILVYEDPVLLVRGWLLHTIDNHARRGYRTPKKTFSAQKSYHRFFVKIKIQ